MRLRRFGLAAKVYRKASSYGWVLRDHFENRIQSPNIIRETGLKHSLLLHRISQKRGWKEKQGGRKDCQFN